MVTISKQTKYRESKVETNLIAGDELPHKGEILWIKDIPVFHKCDILCMDDLLDASRHAVHEDALAFTFMDELC